MSNDRATDLCTAVVDIDGTLLDSNYQLSLAWARAFAHHGHDVPLWRIHRHMGMGGDRLVAAVAGPEVEARDGDAVRERWEKDYDDLLGETRLFDGACALLEGLRGPGSPSCWPARASRGTPSMRCACSTLPWSRRAPERREPTLRPESGLAC
jgi:phosphoglycolate phosphatase-like HAD superfamily hydrolase